MSGLVYTQTNTQIPSEAQTAEEGIIGLYALYENYSVYSAQFKYINTYGPGPSSSEADIELVSYVGPSGFSIVQTTPKILTLSGAVSNAFTDSYYEFVMPDGSIQQLPSNTTEEFLAIIKWNPPSTKITTITHQLQIKIKADLLANTLETIETFSLPQEVYWKYGPSVAAFQNLLSRSTL
jgi:hypothetical protein